MALLRVSSQTIQGFWPLPNIASNHVIIGARLSLSGLGQIVDIRGSSGSIVNFQVTNDGRMQAGIFGSTIYYSVSDLIHADVLFWLVVDVTIHASAGIIDVWVNGIRVIHQTGLNTTPVTSDGTYGWGIVSWGVAGYLSDQYVLDGSGSANNTAVTDRPLLVGRSLMASAGSKTQWTPLSGSNYANVNDATAAGDGDTTYNSTINVADTDLFVPTAISTGDTLRGVQVSVIAKQTDGFGSVAAVIKQSSTEYAGADGATATTYDRVVKEVWNAKPGGGAWGADADFNSLEFGYKKTA